MKLYAVPKCWEFQKNFPEEFESYGCGPGGVGDWFVPDTVYGLSINPACKVHDWDYRHSEGASNGHRKACDERLKKNMFLLVVVGTTFWLLRRLRLTRCRFYYLMVRMFGKQAYWNQRNEDDEMNDFIT